MIKKLDSWFNSINFKQKILLIQLISLVLPLFFISLFIIGYQFYSSRSDLLREIHTIAEVLGENSSAALIFKDQKNAEEILKSLRFNPTVNAAILRLPDSYPIAKYRKDNTFHIISKLYKPSLNVYYEFDWLELHFFKPITLPNQRSATIELQINLNIFYQRLLNFAIAVASISLFFLFLCLSLVNHLQGLIIQPLLKLTNLMRTVSEQQDYAKRLYINDRHDEIGLLARGFNSMLGVIEKHQEGLKNELKERKKTELELSAANLEIHQRHQEINAAYEELARTHQQLVHSEKMVSLGMLIAGIAHELNNPISYIYSNLEFIEEYTERLINVTNNDTDKKITDSDVTTLKELIASCREGSERVKKIVLELRIFSRTEDQGLIPTDLHEGIGSTLNLLNHQCRERIKIHRDFGFIPLVYCYPSQINQVFMNLLQNSIHAIQDHGDIWVKTVPLGEWVRIIIRDNGAGIPDKDLQKIFNPFFTTKDVGMGTGLGLSITYEIIKKHGGKIMVTSQVNIGTEFVIELPVRPSEILDNTSPT